MRIRTALDLTPKDQAEYGTKESRVTVTDITPLIYLIIVVSVVAESLVCARALLCSRALSW